MKLLLAFCFLVGLTFISCKESSHKDNPVEQKAYNETSNLLLIDGSIVYQTENLIIRRLSYHIYEHTSFLDRDNFGKVPCNGMLVINENQGVVFDTPTDYRRANIMRLVAAYSEQKILVIIGSSHKSFIESYLEQMSDVEVLKF